MFSPTRRYQYAIDLIYGANAVLMFSLILQRSSRIKGSNTPYITSEFVLLLLGTLLLASVSAWSIYSGRLQNIRASHFKWWASAVWVITGLGILVTALPLLTFLQPYLLPFFLWWILTSVGIVIMGLGSAKTQSTTHLKPIDNLIAMVLGMALLLFGAEIGLRVWFTYFGSEYERAMYLYSSKDIATRGRLIGAPYVNFTLSPEYTSHNSLGYRGREIAVPKPEGTYRIVAMGGSTTYGISLNWNEAYPAQLETILREDYGYTNVEVVNAGVMFYASWETLANFEFRVLDLAPDMLLVYDGINDVVMRLVDPQYYDGSNPARGIWQINPDPLPPSALYRFIAINVGLMPNPTTLEQSIATQSDIERCSERDFCPNLKMTPQEILSANPPIYFERNLRNLVTLADAHGVRVVFSSWAYFPDTIDQYTSPFMTYSYVQRAVDEQNQILRQIADETNAVFYDLMGSLHYDKGYWLDGIHLSAAGTHEQAKLYAAFLDENGLIPMPSE